MQLLLETISHYAIIVQAITTCVIAWATYVYMRVTTRMFEASIDPSVSVDIFGNIENNKLTIHNDAGCELTDVQVSITIGYSNDNNEYPVRRCIYSHNWASLKSGSTICSRTSPINAHDILESDNDLPEGVMIDMNDLLLDYSFIRTADQRRYCFNYRIGFLRDSKGKKTYIRIGEPTVVPTLKKIILKRIVDNE